MSIEDVLKECSQRGITPEHWFLEKSAKEGKIVYDNQAQVWIDNMTGEPVDKRLSSSWYDEDTPDTENYTAFEHKAWKAKKLAEEKWRQLDRLLSRTTTLVVSLQTAFVTQYLKNSTSKLVAAVVYYLLIQTTELKTTDVPSISVKIL
jgi:hypothetical protein